ncbi:hypothetical protein BpHYR1_013488 [Brachionus plicatilis]|uniref:Uncharacterized protein n=1 Tax=Brachionus plicatilis TaxID=10195 RepID=A0A3M7PKH0_BRAPC|nr:hypothetical protein BpHYR1_013488 [Brachionus plicatilis]
MEALSLLDNVKDLLKILINNGHTQAIKIDILCKIVKLYKKSLPNNVNNNSPIIGNYCSRDF